MDRPVNLYINRPGGDMTALFAVYDTMQFLGPPVHTVCVGQACSAAAVLLAAGEAGPPFALPNARVLIHQPHGGAQGQSTDIEIQVREMVTMRDRMVDVLAERTGQSRERIEADIDRDYILRGDDAVAYGLVDEVIGHREPRAGPRLPSARGGRGRRPIEPRRGDMSGGAGGQTFEDAPLHLAGQGLEPGGRRVRARRRPPSCSCTAAARPGTRGAARPTPWPSAAGTRSALDLRGHGDSDWAPDGDYRSTPSPPTSGRRGRPPDRPPVLVGASLGGLTSLLAGARAPGDRWPRARAGRHRSPHRAGRRQPHPAVHARPTSTGSPPSTRSPTPWPPTTRTDPDPPTSRACARTSASATTVAGTGTGTLRSSTPRPPTSPGPSRDTERLGRRGPHRDGCRRCSCGAGVSDLVTEEGARHSGRAGAPRPVRRRRRRRPHGRRRPQRRLQRRRRRLPGGGGPRPLDHRQHVGRVDLRRAGQQAVGVGEQHGGDLAVDVGLALVLAGEGVDDPERGQRRCAERATPRCPARRWRARRRRPGTRPDPPRPPPWRSASRRVRRWPWAIPPVRQPQRLLRCAP